MILHFSVPFKISISVICLRSSNQTLIPAYNRYHGNKAAISMSQVFSPWKAWRHQTMGDTSKCFNLKYAIMATRCRQRCLHALSVSGGLLHFLSAGFSYSCIVSNDFGHAHSKEAELVVNQFPKFTKVPPTVTVVVNGSSPILQCGATGQPPPQIQWKKVSYVVLVTGSTRRCLSKTWNRTSYS